ncbi:hypothetical protein V6S02_01245 [Microbacterium sp. CCNWLW134]|uniref:hypothetical protein n=1 Tax=Microbacterium sp. CCNWLW134 TaxID=3122064 RepID=UPI00300FAE87
MSDIKYGKLLKATDPTAGDSAHPTLRAWRIFKASRSADAVLTNEGKRTPLGLVILATLMWISRRRNLVLVEFLPAVRRGIKGALVTRAYKFLLPRVVAGAQVMTHWEKDDYAHRYGIPKERLHVIPFYYFDDRLRPEPARWSPAGRTRYLSTGRNACDWDTLLEAAEGEGWPLTIVTRGTERARVVGAAARAGATALADVPRDRHDKMLASAELLLVILQEKAVSAGHVRLMSAATFGTPVILSAIRGVEGYEHLAVATVPPGDALALRNAVDWFLSNPESVRGRMDAIRARAIERPFSKYLAEIENLLHSSVG